MKAFNQEPEPGSLDDQRLFTEADQDLPTLVA